ncbi:MAG: NADH-quinone oxidoreductase subunit A [Acidithiobacillus sp.]|nr:NADH-quinone oxidoreductase subunit A [Acidithiobacillus sp.]
MPLHHAAAVAVFALLALGLLFGLLMLARYLGGRHPSSNKDIPFESGLGVSTATHPATPIRFYLLAVSFLVFELEGAFLYAWAVAFYGLPPAALWGGIAFLVILALGWLYEWAMGGLRWT